MKVLADLRPGYLAGLILTGKPRHIAPVRP